MTKTQATEAEVEAGVPVKCEGCGTSWKLSDLKREHPQALSCCPERRMVKCD